MRLLKSRCRLPDWAPLVAPLASCDVVGAMSISLRIAQTDGERDLAYRLRYQVYVEEEGLFPPHPEQRVVDRFDAFDATTTVVAFDDDAQGVCIGTLRFLKVDGQLGHPGVELYDFTDVIEDEAHRGQCGTMGMLAIARSHRHRRGLLLGLCKMAWRELRRDQVRYIVAPCSDEMHRVMRGMGAVDLGPRRAVGQNPSVEVTPVLLDMEHIAPMFRESSVDPVNLVLERLDERRIFRQGEYLVEQGKEGKEAFIIMRGVAQLVVDGQPTPHFVGPGELVGEIALLQHGPRSASLLVESRLLDVGVINRTRFDKRMRKDPEFVEKVLGFLIRRVRYLQSPFTPEIGAPVPAADEARHNQRQVAAQLLLLASLEGQERVLVRWLAADAGLARGELETLLQEWAEAGLLARQEDELEVLDPDGLRERVRSPQVRR